MEFDLREYVILVDTCSLMCDMAEDFFMNKFQPYLKANDKTIILQYKVGEEINKLQKSEKKETRHRAKAAARLLNKLVRDDVIKHFGSPNDKFADHQFIKVLVDFRDKFNICIITQDSKLAGDLINNANTQSVLYNKDVKILRINEDNTLRDWVKIKEGQALRSGDGNGNGSKNGHQSLNNNQSSVQLPVIKPSDKFALGTKVKNLDTKSLVTFNTDNLNRVYSQRYGYMNLIKEIGGGGEGTVYETQNGLACKIYKPGKCTKFQEEKISLMLKKTVDIEGVCWPLDIVTYNNTFVGYVMNKAAGNTIQRSMFVKPVLLKNYPNWTRKHLVELCETILYKVYSLHSRNIIIGDINPMNILVKNEKEVYFVDTDSYQIENFPCTVGTINFTAPEIQRKNYKTFLRTFEHENFALATLMFMILLPGKSPYSQQGGGDAAQNIINQEFSYPYKEQSNGRAPQGPWRFIWSNLPFKVKEKFYDIFQNNNRISSKEWIELIDIYLKLLNQGKASDEIFPTSLKIIDPTVVTCALCGKKYNESKRFVDKLNKQNKECICKTCFTNKISNQYS